MLQIHSKNLRKQLMLTTRNTLFLIYPSLVLSMVISKFIYYFNISCDKKKMFYILDQLPFSIRVLLESAVRNCDNFQVTENDVQNILKWKTNQTVEGGVEVAFKPARVILQVKK